MVITGSSVNMTLYVRPGSRGSGKFEVRWEEGIWYGVSGRTGARIIGTKDGVGKVRVVGQGRRRRRRMLEGSMMFEAFRGSQFREGKTLKSNQG